MEILQVACASIKLLSVNCAVYVETVLSLTDSVSSLPSIQRVLSSTVPPSLYPRFLNQLPSWSFVYIGLLVPNLRPFTAVLFDFASKLHKKETPSLVQNPSSFSTALERLVPRRSPST